MLNGSLSIFLKKIVVSCVFSININKIIIDGVNNCVRRWFNLLKLINIVSMLESVIFIVRLVAISLIGVLCDVSLRVIVRMVFYYRLFGFFIIV